MPPDWESTANELTLATDRARPQIVRPVLEFAEQSIVIPDGPFVNRRFRADRQPYSALLFDAVDSGLWQRFVITGPSQSGKTLVMLILLMYCLFELRETCIFGLPSADMAGDKWDVDIKPIIEAGQYAKYLPLKGEGSKGGRVRSLVSFGNGTKLRFLTGGGGGKRGDKSRAGYTARNLFITETDGLDESSKGSDEGDKIAQLEARTEAYNERARVFKESTVSTEEGHTWREYTNGTQSRIAQRCPHCRRHVTCEREHLVGWKDAADIMEARANAAWVCPSCGAAWSNDEHRAAAAESILVHKGQTIKRGRVHGDLPRTDTLGFRWSAVDNLFKKASATAAAEWRAERDPRTDNAEKIMRQFHYALPAATQVLSTTKLASEAIAARMVDVPQGMIPKRTAFVTAGIDIGQYATHWVLLAWSQMASPHVVDYGVIEVSSDELGIDLAVLTALREFRGLCIDGWPFHDEPELTRAPDVAFFDAGWEKSSTAVYAFCNEKDSKQFTFYPSKGFGHNQYGKIAYTQPNKKSERVKHIGEHYHIARLANRKDVWLADVDADAWKLYVNARLKTPIGAAGAMTFYDGGPRRHMTIAKHICAEEQVEEFKAGVGRVQTFKVLNRRNHYLDCLQLASAAGHFAGVRLFEETPDDDTKQPTTKLDEWFKR